MCFVAQVGCIAVLNVNNHCFR